MTQAGLHPPPEPWKSLLCDQSQPPVVTGLVHRRFQRYFREFPQEYRWASLKELRQHEPIRVWECRRDTNIVVLTADDFVAQDRSFPAVVCVLRTFEGCLQNQGHDEHFATLGAPCMS